MTEIKINRAPFLTLWAKVVARRLGFDEEESLTLGSAICGLTAQAKGRRIGLYQRRSEEERQSVEVARLEKGGENVEFMGWRVPCLRTDGGLRALKELDPIPPDRVRRYLESKFGEHLDLVEGKLTALAEGFGADELAEEAMNVYARLRPDVPKGREGWGRQGLLDTDNIDRLTRQREARRTD
jgi:hypothetical protein